MILATKKLSEQGKGDTKNFPAEIHGRMAGMNHGGFSFVACYFLWRQGKIFRYPIDDDLGSNRTVSVGIFQNFFDILLCDFPLRKLLAGGQFLQDV
jgi:hypothetical protein